MRQSLKVIYHPLYGMNNYVHIWGDWLSRDPLRGSHDSQSPHIRKHLCPILWQLWFICHKIIHIRDDISPLKYKAQLQPGSIKQKPTWNSSWKCEHFNRKLEAWSVIELASMWIEPTNLTIVDLGKSLI